MAALTFASTDAEPAGVETRPRVSHEGGRTIVWLDGEHDIATVSRLAGNLATAIASDDTDLVVDMSGVEFIGAASISVMLRGQILLHARSRELTVRDPSRCARRVIDICGLEGLIDPTGPAA